MTTDNVPASHPVPPDLAWDDELWELVWERNLNVVERHTIGVDVVRGRLPVDTPFDAAVGEELARRWRRSCRNHAIGWVLWALFWGSIALNTRGVVDASLLPLVATTFGATMVTGALGLREWLLRVVQEAEERRGLHAGTTAVGDRPVD